jgi:hypothetical protein
MCIITTGQPQILNIIEEPLYLVGLLLVDIVDLRLPLS